MQANEVKSNIQGIRCRPSRMSKSMAKGQGEGFREETMVTMVEQLGEPPVLGGKRKKISHRVRVKGEEGRQYGIQQLLSYQERNNDVLTGSPGELKKNYSANQNNIKPRSIIQLLPTFPELSSHKPSQSTAKSSYQQGSQPVFFSSHAPQNPITEMNSSFEQSSRQYYYPNPPTTTTEQPRELVGRSSPICAICNQKIYLSEVTNLESCKHSLHKQCLLPYLQIKIKESSTTTIPCPFTDCPTIMSEGFLRRVLPAGDLEQYYRFSAFSFVERMMEREGWMVCTEPNCREVMGVVRLGLGVGHARKNLLECTKTGKRTCLRCRKEYHPQFTCEEFMTIKDVKSNDKKLLNVVRQSGWKQCPKCKLYIEKNEGCNHIQCRCGTHFCYACLGPYPNCLCPNARHINELPAEFAREQQMERERLERFERERENRERENRERENREREQREQREREQRERYMNEVEERKNRWQERERKLARQEMDEEERKKEQLKKQIQSKMRELQSMERKDKERKEISTKSKWEIQRAKKQAQRQKQQIERQAKIYKDRQQRQDKRQQQRQLIERQEKRQKEKQQRQDKRQKQRQQSKKQREQRRQKEKQSQMRMKKMLEQVKNKNYYQDKKQTRQEQQKYEEYQQKAQEDAKRQKNYAYSHYEDNNLDKKSFPSKAQTVIQKRSSHRTETPNKPEQSKYKSPGSKFWRK